MNSPSILPADVRTALMAVRVVSPNAVVSGGYLRDTLNSVPPKDIDVFCGPLSDGALKLLNSMFPAMRQQVSEAAADYVFGSENRGVAAVWDLGIAPEGLPMQLIVVTPETAVLDVFKRNDFGICQLQDDGETLTMTAACAKDMAERTFTLVACENERERERSLRRWARLGEKYPDFKLVEAVSL